MALPDFTRVEMVSTYSGEHHHLSRWGQEGVLARRTWTPPACQAFI